MKRRPGRFRAMAGAALLTTAALARCESHETAARDGAGSPAAPTAAAKLDTLYAQLGPLIESLDAARDALAAIGDELEAMRDAPVFHHVAIGR